MMEAEPHIFDRAFGPLTGEEWNNLAQTCRRISGRGKGAKSGYADEFPKLVAHFNVPLAELEAAE